MKHKKLTRTGEKLVEIYNRLLATYGPQVCFLHHNNPFELIIAVILSAQCTDKTVNATTPALFARYPDAEALARATPEEVEPYIKAIGLTKAKSKYIVETARALCERFNGEVPGTMEALTTLPGVGRKTANVVLADAFDVPGFAVDTHVNRLTNRIGIAKSTDPVVIEKAVCRHLPPQYWGSFSHLLIVHGRSCCSARAPKCAACPLADLCKSAKMPSS